eukprot:tig00000269_g23777.t1
MRATRRASARAARAVGAPVRVGIRPIRSFYVAVYDISEASEMSGMNGGLAGYPPTAADTEGWYHHMYKENARLRARNDALTDENTGLLDLVRNYKQRSYAHEAEISKYKRRLGRAMEALKKAGMRVELSSDSEGEDGYDRRRRHEYETGDQELPNSSHAGSPRSGSSDRDIVPQQKPVNPKESRRREEERRAQEKAKQEQLSGDDGPVRRSNRKRKPIVRDDFDQPAPAVSDEEGGQLEAAEMIRCLSNAPTPRGSPVHRGIGGARREAPWPEDDEVVLSLRRQEERAEGAEEEEAPARGARSRRAVRARGRPRGAAAAGGRAASRAGSRRNSVDEEGAARARRQRAEEAEEAGEEEDEDEDGTPEDDGDEDYVENSRRAREIDAAHNGGNLIGIDLDDPNVWRKKRIPVGAAAAASGKKARRTSQYRGVYWEEQRGKWRAQMQDGNTRRHLGYFNTEEEAAECYQNAMREMQRAQVSGKRFNVPLGQRREPLPQRLAALPPPRPAPAQALNPEMLAAELLHKVANTPRGSPAVSPRRCSTAAMEPPALSLAASAAAALGRDLA